MNDIGKPDTGKPASTASEQPRQARPVQVLHIIQSIRYGGIETCLLNWVDHFQDDDYEMHLAYFANDRGRESQFLDAVKAYGFTARPIPWGIHKPFISAARVTAELVDELNIDIIHTHGYYADVLGALAARRCQVHTIATVYVWGKFSMRRQWSVMLDKIAVRYIDKVTAHCDFTFDTMVENGFPAEKLSKLIAGFPNIRSESSAESRKEFRERMGLSPDDVLIFNAARMQKEKAHDHLLHAYFMVKNRYPQAKLWIAGVGWKGRERELRELTLALGLENDVRYLGFIDDLYPYFDAADIVAQPSHIEGVPLTFLQAMSVGRTVVCYDVGGVKEIIKHEDTGMLVQHRSIEMLTETLLRLIDDATLRDQIGTNAKQFVNTEYSMDTAINQLRSSYEELLSTRRLAHRTQAAS